MHKREFLAIAAAGLAWLAGGCAGVESDLRQTGRIRFVSGEGRVVAVQAELGMVTAETAEGRRTLWWDLRTEVYRGHQRLSTLEMKPGLAVAYRGMESNGEIYLRKLWLK